MNETRPRRPWISALLTFLAPGLGQLYGGEPRRAFVIYLAGTGLLVALLLSGAPRTFLGLIAFLSVFLLYLLWVTWDAVRLSQRRKDYELKPYNRWYVYPAVIVMTGILWQPLPELSPVRAFRIPTSGMEPTLRVGDHLYADVTYYRSRGPSRGDLILFASPQNPASLRLARVIGLAGEQIEIRDRVVHINGKPLADSWGHFLDSHDDPLGSGNPRFGRRENFPSWRIPDDTAFVLGDNRNRTIDSRILGAIPLSSLRGRPLYVYWAVDKSRIGTSLR